MPDRAPEHLYVLRLARDGRSVEGAFPISGMERLAGLLHSTHGVAGYVLNFGLDAASRPQVDGRIRASLEVICQRCLKPMTATLDLEVRLGIVRTEAEAVALPEDREPLQIDDETVPLGVLLEDELILGLPAAPLHPAGACRPPAGADHDQTEAEAADNPFAVLSVLKSKDPSGEG